MFNVVEVGSKEIAQRLRASGGALMDTIAGRVQALAIRLQGYIVTNKLSGQVLNVGKAYPGHTPGQLRSSITSAIDRNDPVITGRVFSAGDVKYAAIHEFGGTIHHPGGTAYYIDRSTGLARFVSNSSGAAEYLPRTRPHDIVMPERSFMRTGLADFKPTIVEELAAVATMALRAAVMGGA
jgi:phage gpG-like protein